MSTQTMYNAYRAAGLTHEGTLSMLGNGDCESNNVSFRKQGDFSEGFAKSAAYTRAIDTGAISRDAFADGLTGYGRYQWTYKPRQQSLFDAARREGCSIGDEDFQTRFSIREMQTDFPGVWQIVTTSHSLSECVNIVCRVYENPAVKNYTERYKAAKRIEAELAAGQAQEIPAVHAEVYWPPRMIDRNMSGPDVEVWQTILKARGYGINYVSGKFDELLEAETKRFQSDNGLTADGVVGPMTWRRGLAYGD